MIKRLHVVSFIPLWLSVFLALPALSCLAQNTCYTNPQGTTICSNAGGVIHGNTNSAGNSVYRDDRGNRLEFQTDSAGNASVQPVEGEAIRWSQPVLGEQKYPDSGRPVIKGTVHLIHGETGFQDGIAPNCTHCPQN